jgi:ubiquinone/menaquinone biosynthesis C-methylase UbiE
MITKDENDKKSVSTRDWYDFVGQLSDILPSIHPGGLDATRALLEMCSFDAASRVLDVGCGSGSTACLIAEDYGSSVYGIDLSEVMVAKAKERAKRQGLSEKTEFRVADVLDLPYDDQWFDGVILESVLTPLLGDKKQALREIVRVVRPGGRIGANESTVDPETPPEILALLAKHPAFHGHFTPEMLRDLFVGSGLEVIEMRELKDVDIPKALKGIGLGGLVKFMIQVYPKLVLRLIRDQQIRAAQKIDDELTKMGKEHLGYALIVGQKSG